MRCHLWLTKPSRQRSGKKHRGTGGFEFNSRLGQIGHSVANGLQSLRLFFASAALSRRLAVQIIPQLITGFGVILLRAQ